MRARYSQTRPHARRKDSEEHTQAGSGHAWTRWSAMDCTRAPDDRRADRRCVPVTVRMRYLHQTEFSRTYCQLFACIILSSVLSDAIIAVSTWLCSLHASDFRRQQPTIGIARIRSRLPPSTASQSGQASTTVRASAVRVRVKRRSCSCRNHFVSTMRTRLCGTAAHSEVPTLWERGDRTRRSSTCAILAARQEGQMPTRSTRCASSVRRAAMSGRANSSVLTSRRCRLHRSAVQILISPCLAQPPSARRRQLPRPWTMM